MIQFIVLLIGIFSLIAGVKGWIWKEPALKAVIVLLSLILIFFGLFSINITLVPSY